MLDDVRALVWLVTVMTWCSEAQRTYQRHCDCEYVVDGRCAYMLLLPTMSGGEMTCPPVGANLSDSLSRLRDDVGALQTWTGEHAKAVVTLQNAVGGLTEAVQRLQRGGGGGDSTPGSIDAVTAAVDRLNRTVADLTALCGGRCGDDPNTTGTEAVVNRYRLCGERGLIVVNSVDDSAITASSVRQSSSASDVRINSSSSADDSDSAGAWCAADDTGQHLSCVHSPSSVITASTLLAHLTYVTNFLFHSVNLAPHLIFLFLLSLYFYFFSCISPLTICNSLSLSDLS